MYMISVLLHSKVEYFLLQVKEYLTTWPEAEWGPVDYKKICVMSPSATQVSFYFVCVCVCTPACVVCICACVCVCVVRVCVCGVCVCSVYMCV